MAQSQSIWTDLLCLGGPYCFAKGCKTIVLAVTITTMQAMSHPVRCLRPSPDIALKNVCQTTLCFPAPWTVVAPCSKQNTFCPMLIPHWACQKHVHWRKAASSLLKKKIIMILNFKRFELSKLILKMHVCILFAQVCTVYTWFAQSLHLVYIFQTRGFSPGKKTRLRKLCANNVQIMCKPCKPCANHVQTFFVTVCSMRSSKPRTNIVQTLR